MDAVQVAFAAVPRRDFLPARRRHRASYDGPIGIGRGQTNSQPRTVEDMLRLLAVRSGQRVLDVGAGSGWTTALLAQLVGPTGRVVGTEIVPELAAWGEGNVRATGFGWAAIRPARPDVLGVPEEAPYDRILVSAEAPRLPEQLVEQLADGGRLVVPVRGTMTLLVRDGTGREVTRHGGYRFVPLRGPSAG